MGLACFFFDMLILLDSKWYSRSNDILDPYPVTKDKKDIRILNIAHVETTPKHPRGAVFFADYDSMSHPGQRFVAGT